MKYYDDEPSDETELEKWNKENSIGQAAGICPKCGSIIFQSTYADFCMCGEQDYSY